MHNNCFIYSINQTCEIMENTKTLLIEVTSSLRDAANLNNFIKDSGHLWDAKIINTNSTVLRFKFQDADEVTFILEKELPDLLNQAGVFEFELKNFFKI